MEAGMGRAAAEKEMETGMNKADRAAAVVPEWAEEMAAVVCLTIM